MRPASLFASVAPILFLACAPAAPSGGPRPAPTAVTVAATAPTATANRALEPTAPAAPPVAARQAVLDAACANRPSEAADRAIHEDLCAHFDEDDATPLRRRAFAFVSAHPDSDEAAFVYVYFAETFRREAAKDPSKRELAVTAYEAVLDRSSPFESYAHLALAQVATEAGKADDATNASVREAGDGAEFSANAFKHYGLSLRTRGGWAVAEVSTEAITGLGELWAKHRKSRDFGTFLTVHAFLPWQGIGVVGGYMKAGDPTSARAVLRTILERTERAEGCELLRPLAAKLADPADPLDAALHRACP